MSKAARNPTGRSFVSRYSNASLFIRNMPYAIFHMKYRIWHMNYLRGGSSSLTQRGGLHSLHVFVHPRDHLPQSVFDRFAGGVSMRFERQRHITNVAAIAFERLIHAVALD